MPISSFYGLQTSLRGLLAQQRMLDTAGHNIANASTQGYSRQEVNLVASPALLIPAGGTASGGLASLGSGVDVQNYRRVRDGFLDLQYRGQATNFGNWQARSEALDRAELALQEPGDDGINAQLAEFWDSWSDLVNAPSDPAARQALLAQGAALADSFRTVYDQLTTVGSQALAEYADLARPAGAGDPGGEIAQLAKEIATLNDTIKRQMTAGDSPNDLLDRRDLLLDKLAEFGQISVEQIGTTGAVKVSFVDAATPATTYSIVDGATATWAGAPAGDAWAPGGRLGALLDVAKPGGTLDQYKSALDAVAGSLISTVNAAYGGTFLETATASNAAGLRVNPALVASPSSITAGSGGAGSNDIAVKVAALRDGAAVDGAYRAFVARVGADVREATRQTSNAQALTDAVEDRRQSVAGVSMDEEMSNLVRFQRSYQASARAMSTMDEMLDVLINRTGRVGL
jgi:flagellar hook-associated protein 1 FlgK